MSKTIFDRLAEGDNGPLGYNVIAGMMALANRWMRASVGLRVRMPVTDSFDLAQWRAFVQGNNGYAPPPISANTVSDVVRYMRMTDSEFKRAVKSAQDSA